jgi:ectoine hydroxylase
LFYPAFFSNEEISASLQELDRLSRDERICHSDMVILERESQEIRSIFAIHTLSDHFRHLVRDPRILSRANQLLGSQTYIHQSRINYKPGFKGKGFSWHSDFETWHAEDGMPRMRAVSCSITLTENNDFNGPLMLVPGSHNYFIPCQGETPENHYKMSLRKQQLGVPDEDSMREMIQRGGIVAPKGPAGSMLLFECNLLHGSNANMSPYPRSNLFLVYNSVANRIRQPYAARFPRPTFLADRSNETLQPDNPAQL